jgi:signal transduction histidine kinase
MRPAKWLYLFFCLLTVKGVSQSAHQFYIDSISALLQHAPEDTTRAYWMGLLTEAKYTARHADSFQWAKKTLLLSEKLGYTSGKVVVYRLIGAWDCERHLYARGIRYYKHALALAEKENLHVHTYRLYSDILNVYFLHGDYPAAMKISIRGLELATRLKNEKKRASFLNLVGYIYFKLGDRKNGKKFFTQYYELAKKLNEPLMIGSALGNLADIYTEEEKYDKSLQLHTAAIKAFENHVGGRERVIFTWYSMSRIYTFQNKLDTALHYVNKVMDGVKSGIPVNEYDLAGYYLGAGEIYMRKGNTELAIEVLRKGLAIATRIQHRGHKKDGYDFLAQTYAKMGRYDSAYFYRNAYVVLKDSLVNEKTSQQVAELHTLYEVDKKDQEIALKKSELEREKVIRYFIIGLSLFSLLMLALLYNRYRLRQKNKFQQTLTRQQNEMFGRIIQVQESERKRIAEDLHDGLGSLLSAVKLKIDQLGRMSHGDAENKEKYKEMAALIDETIREMRGVAHSIMPPTLSKLGLVSALRNLFDGITSSSHLKIHFNAHNLEFRLKEDIETGVYRIILEGMNNVIKHAHASEVTVQLVMYQDYLNVSIEDNGKGFEYHENNSAYGLGMTNMISRVNFLKGKLNIDSALNRGTTLMVDIPV